MYKYILFPALLLLLAACSNDEQPNKPFNAVTTGTKNNVSTVAPSEVRPLASHKMIFFLNPNGGPCRIQVSILNDMADELRGTVDIQYVQTTVQGDRDIFYQYGIRALPTLLLADSSGKEIKRMTPGVKEAADIRHMIQSIP